MRRYIIIVLCLIGIQVYAFDRAPFDEPMQVPAATMCSVNDTKYMASGSALSSTVYEVSSSSPERSLRRGSGPSVDDSGYDTGNPQFAPVGDAIIPLLAMALIYLLVAYRRKAKVSCLCI